MAPRAEVCGLGRTEEDIKKPRSLLDVGTLTRDTRSRPRPCGSFRRTRPTAARARARRLRRPTRFPSRRVPRRNEPTHPPFPPRPSPTAKPRRVAFCVGDDAAAVADARAWTAARLEPTDDVIMLHVCVPTPPRSAPTSNSTTPRRWTSTRNDHHSLVTPPCATVSRAARRPSPQPLPRRPPRRPREPPPRVRLPDTARAPDVVAPRRPRRGAALERPRTVSDAVVRNSPCPRLVLRRDGSACVAGGRSPGTGRAGLRGFRFTPPRSPVPRLRPAGRAGPSPGTFASHARNFARPTPRRVVIAVDGSDASSRAVRWCRDALLRPTDEVILAHAVSWVSNTRSVASTPNASRRGPWGRRRARRRRDARRVARARTRARTRVDDTAVPEPRRRTRTISGSPGMARRGASGSSVSGERALAIGQTFGRRRRNRRIDAGGLRGAPRRWGRAKDGGHALKTPTPIRSSWGVARRGWRRAMSPSVSTHLVENAPCPCLVYREPAREDEGGKRGAPVVTRRGSVSNFGSRGQFETETKFHR